MSQTLVKQNIDKQTLSIFIRDLASNVNVNLKHMIEDNIRGKAVEKKKKGKGKNNRKEVIKKKDIIILRQILSLPLLIKIHPNLFVFISLKNISFTGVE